MNFKDQYKHPNWRRVRLAFDGVEAISKSNGGIVEINFTARPRSEFEVVF